GRPSAPTASASATTSRLRRRSSTSHGGSPAPLSSSPRAGVMPIQPFASGSSGGRDVDGSYRFDDLQPAHTFFVEHGFVKLTDLLSNDERASLAAAYDEAVEQGTITKSETKVESNNDAVLSHPAFAALLTHPRLVALAELVVGGLAELQH